MKRRSVLLAAPIVLGLTGCATIGGGGAGGGGVYSDCSVDYCVEYDGLNAQRLYLRTPGSLPPGARGDVNTASTRGGTQVVTRDASTPAASSARMAPIPASRPSGSSRSGGRQP